MAEETKKAAPETAEEVVVCDVPVAEEPTNAVAGTEAEPEKAVEGEKETEVAESVSFKEESNKVDDLIDPEKKALDELKSLIQEALNKHEFTSPPPPPPSAVIETAEEPKSEEVKEEPKSEEVKEEPKSAEEKKEEPKPEEEKTEEEKIESCEAVSEAAPRAPEEKETPEEAVVEKVEEKVEAAEEIKETIVQEVKAEEAAAAPAEEEVAPEEVSIWGVTLLADERSDAILLKFLRARDFKVKEAFAMVKNVVAWRKEFKIDELLVEEGIGEGLEKVVYVNGVDKEGHPICYNAFGEFQDKELYSNTFSDAEKRAKFLRFYIQFLEKRIRGLDFSPEGICTIVQVTDLKNSPGLFFTKKELRQATNQALQLLQDNYPEFVAKQVFINVPWWYVAYNRMISPFLTQRTKSKFVFAGPTKTAETLFKYAAPEQVPVQYGGLSKAGGEFTTADTAVEEIIKPASKHTIELPISEGGTLAWEVRVVGWDVSYGAEFVPSAEGGYTWIIQKSRKIGQADEDVLSCSFKIGEPGKVVLTFDNQTSKKKKLLFRSNTKCSE
ncbi:hypothetical protein SASPL_115615 [Salvia splendens]|uniref:Uncharacterized protein n=1 Tax=Salvia splendens TaxID=180675 RepID=A0A8X9A369_SALSN|nr:patellin-3-like [Salvia splendens]KAG6425189.1 hypothetical protein SASPL_115615 [Salvia splendens]